MHQSPFPPSSSPSAPPSGPPLAWSDSTGPWAPPTRQTAPTTATPGTGQVLGRPAGTAGSARSASGAGRVALVLLAALVVGAGAGGVTGALVSGDDGVTEQAAPAPAPAADIGAETPSAAPEVVTDPAPAISGTIDVRAVVAEAGPSVVSITTRSLIRQGPYVMEGGGAGSGVAIEGGYVVTNAHVVEGATAIELTSATSGITTRGVVVAIEPGLDLALVQLEDPTGFAPATLGDSADVQVGDPVVAIGNALGLGGSPTVTQGIVSALDRTITTSGGRLSGLLQTDTAISSGNSGGPLLDASGAVIGINTAVAGSGGGVQASNVGFVVPVDTVRAFVDAHLAR